MDFQCAADGDAAIIGTGIGYCVDFGYVFSLGEYRYYGNHRHSIGASLEVAHGNDAVAVLLNGRNVALVCVNEDDVDVDDGSDGVAEGRMTRETTTWMRGHSLGPLCSCALGWWEWEQAAGQTTTTMATGREREHGERGEATHPPRRFGQWADAFFAPERPNPIPS